MKSNPSEVMVDVPGGMVCCSYRMVKLLKQTLVIFTCLSVAGCPSDVQMKERFVNREMRIMTDERGRKYCVQHHMGDMYTVKPYNP